MKREVFTLVADALAQIEHIKSLDDCDLRDGLEHVEIYLNEVMGMAND